MQLTSRDVLAAVAAAFEVPPAALRSRTLAASNAVGLAVDSALFLWLAFGSLDFLAGQVLGKAWMTALAVALLWAIRWPLVQARAA